MTKKLISTTQSIKLLFSVPFTTFSYFLNSLSNLDILNNFKVYRTTHIFCGLFFKKIKKYIYFNRQLDVLFIENKHNF